MSDDKKTVTIKDLARITGVSTGVISVILRGENKSNIRYSKETHDKVVKAANELNFRLNNSGKSLITGKHNALGLLSQNWLSVPQDYYSGISHEAQQTGQLIIMGHFEKAADCRIVQEDIVDGLILFDELNDDVSEKIQRFEIPHVWVNVKSGTASNIISFDDQQCIRDAHAYFNEQGFHNAAFCYEADYKSEHISLSQRLAACQQMNISLLPVSGEGQEHASREQRYAYYQTTIEQYIQERTALDAIIAHSGFLVPSIYRALARCDRAIPGDVAVLGIHKHNQHITVEPPCSEMTLPQFDVGRMAVQRLLSQINGEALAPAEPIPYHVLERASTKK